MKLLESRMRRDARRASAEPPRRTDTPATVTDRPAPRRRTEPLWRITRPGAA